MRKLLLATVAALGVAAVYDGAVAQQAVEDAGQSTTSAFGGAAVGPSQAPGTLIVRLNGRVRTVAGIMQTPGVQNGAYYYNNQTGTASTVPFLSGPAPNTSTSLAAVPAAGQIATVASLPRFFGTAAQATAAGFRPATVLTGPGAGQQNVVVQPNQPNVNKNSNYLFGEYLRLYPGVDGIAANGLMYGAGVEIRQDSNSPAGGSPGQYGSASTNTVTEGRLYVRRDWVYVGTPELGMIRFGATDGPSDLFMVGNNENFGDGGWNGDFAGYLPGNAWLPWPFADVGALYVTNKIVYLSPAFAGFDFGVAFEPNNSGPLGPQANQGCNSTGSYTQAVYVGSGPGVAGAGCTLLSSTNTPDYSRRRNTVDVGVRYRGLFGPVGFAAYVDFLGGGTVNDTLTSAHQQVDGLQVGTGGAQITYGGLTIGAMALGGRVNWNQWTLSPKGSGDSTAWEVGGSYTYGPFIVGAHFYEFHAPGASGPTVNPNGLATGVPSSVGQLRERGLAVGGTYSVAPGLAINLTTLWGERFQNGRDFLTNELVYNTLNPGGNGATTARPANLHNKVTDQLVSLGLSVTW